MKDIYLSCQTWIMSNIKKASNMCITHIIIISEKRPVLDEKF